MILLSFWYQWRNTFPLSKHISSSAHSLSSNTLSSYFLCNYSFITSIKLFIKLYLYKIKFTIFLFTLLSCLIPEQGKHEAFLLPSSLNSIPDDYLHFCAVQTISKFVLLTFAEHLVLTITIIANASFLPS